MHPVPAPAAPQMIISNIGRGGIGRLRAGTKGFRLRAGGGLRARPPPPPPPWAGAGGRPAPLLLVLLLLEVLTVTLEMRPRFCAL